MLMTLTGDRITLAVVCGSCSQITGVPVYNNSLHIARCVGCGRPFDAPEMLVQQYRTTAERISTYDELSDALQQARNAMTSALEHWGRKAGKDALSQALDVS
jgi:hypothetical protein